MQRVQRDHPLTAITHSALKSLPDNPRELMRLLPEASLLFSFITGLSD